MLFAVERFDESGAGGQPAFPELPSSVRIAGVVHLPADQVVLALVEGPDELAVRDAVGGAGWRVDRINQAQWLPPTEVPT